MTISFYNPLKRDLIVKLRSMMQCEKNSDFSPEFYIINEFIINNKISDLIKKNIIQKIKILIYVLLYLDDICLTLELRP